MKTKVKIDVGLLSGKTGYIDGYVYGFIGANMDVKGPLAIVVLDDSNQLVEVPIWKLSRLEEK